MSPSTNFTFYFWVCRQDAALAVWMLRSLRRQYPDHEVIAISDGSLLPVEVEAIAGLRVNLVNSGTEKWLDGGDQFLITRYEALLAATTAEILIKIDPDSEFHPPKEISIPNSLWWGQIFSDSAGIGTWGCGMGIRRDILEMLVDPRNQSSQITGAQFQYTNPVTGKTLSSEDSTLAYRLNALGVYPDPWADVSLGFTFKPEYMTGKWAITHPSLGKRIPTNRFLVIKLFVNQMDAELLTKIATELRRILFDGQITLVTKGDVDGDFLALVVGILRPTRARIAIAVEAGADLSEFGEADISADYVWALNPSDQQLAAMKADCPSIRRKVNPPLLTGGIFNVRCLKPRTEIVVSPSGDVFWCDRCGEGSGQLMGNVADQSIEDVWYGEKFLDHRYMLLQVRDTNPCRTCRYPGDGATPGGWV